MMEAVQVRLERAITTIEHHARLISELERAQPAVVAKEVDGIKEDLKDMRDELRSLKRSLYTLALTIAAAAITFAFTAFQVWDGG